jgi:hypothetical protein
MAVAVALAGLVVAVVAVLADVDAVDLVTEVDVAA